MSRPHIRHRLGVVLAAGLIAAAGCATAGGVADDERSLPVTSTLSGPGVVADALAALAAGRVETTTRMTVTLPDDRPSPSPVLVDDVAADLGTRRATITPRAEGGNTVVVVDDVAFTDVADLSARLAAGDTPTGDPVDLGGSWVSYQPAERFGALDFAAPGLILFDLAVHLRPAVGESTSSETDTADAGLSWFEAPFAPHLDTFGEVSDEVRAAVEEDLAFDLIRQPVGGTVRVAVTAAGEVAVVELETELSLLPVTFTWALRPGGPLDVSAPTGVVPYLRFQETLLGALFGADRDVDAEPVVPPDTPRPEPVRPEDVPLQDLPAGVEGAGPPPPELTDDDLADFGDFVGEGDVIVAPAAGPGDNQP
jgi:hypothetical protein